MIHDHGQNDPLEYTPDRDTDAVADFTRKVIQIHRAHLNARDQARQMAANEREIARMLGKV